MKLVIDIPEKIYKWVCKSEHFPYRLNEIIKKGTPLPKGHSRLIDEKDVIENICELRGCYGRNNCNSKLDNFCGSLDVVKNVPTIIEADKEE